MNRKRSIWTGITASLAMVMLILDSKTAFQGAYDGIRLCLATVIPSLFPFMVLSGIITNSMAGIKFSVLRLPGRICRIPVGSEVILLTGLVGGYPVGAQCISRAYENGQLTREDAQRMLGFCSNAGPAFIFGMTAVIFQNKAVPCILWAIQILSALAVGAILPGGSENAFNSQYDHKIKITDSIAQCVRTMGFVCGWIVIFRIVIAFLERWFLWLVPAEIAVLLKGCLELSNGCVSLADVESEAVRFVLCSGMLSFGGVCVWLQTISVTGALKTRAYLPGKLLQAVLSFLCSMIISILLFPGELTSQFYTRIGLLGCIGAVISFLIYKKSSGIVEKSVV